jgi:hypothetical protein
MKRAYVLQQGSKFYLVTKCVCTSDNRSRYSVMMIQFRTSTKHVKLTESNVYNTQARFTTRSEVQTVC